MNQARCFAALLIAACAGGQVAAKPDAPTLTGVVTRVSDGDTLWVRPNSDGKPLKPIKLRLLGIDAPERCQAGGPAATAALTSHVLHRVVVVRTVGRDSYGRLLGDVHLQGEDLGAWLVREGHAWSHRRFGVADVYAAEERDARMARRGLFADSGALEPRVFRKRNGPCD
ncbi:MAG: thermonuclease family protein [Burkholderiaceae bacterium]|nr:thermonuclease family protein [Burkholderiaceae bacterium]